jgi:hypothetical protein
MWCHPRRHFIASAVKMLDLHSSYGWLTQHESWREYPLLDQTCSCKNLMLSVYQETLYNLDLKLMGTVREI